MKHCKCKTNIITTNFCPDCGEEQKTKPRKYLVDGNTYVNRKLAIKTNEFRCPLKGEYFLSGAKPMAYLAGNDLSTEYWIAKIL